MNGGREGDLRGNVKAEGKERWRGENHGRARTTTTTTTTSTATTTAIEKTDTEEMGPNILQDDTLPSQVDKKLLGTVRTLPCFTVTWGKKGGGS